jgi:hypothetical protein
MPATLKSVRCEKCREMVEVIPHSGVLKVHGSRGQICSGSGTAVESGGAGRAPRKPRPPPAPAQRDEETIPCPGCGRSVIAFLGTILDHWKSEFGGAWCSWSGKERPGWKPRLGSA